MNEVFLTEPIVSSWNNPYISPNEYEKLIKYYNTRTWNNFELNELEIWYECSDFNGTELTRNIVIRFRPHAFRIKNSFPVYPIFA